MVGHKIDYTQSFFSIRVVDIDVARGAIMLTNPKARPDEQKREFTFDAVYDWK